MDIDQGPLNTIRANHPGDVGGCCRDLWKKWLELDPDATWDKLFTAIDDCAATSAPSSTSTHLICYYMWYRLWLSIDINQFSVVTHHYNQCVHSNVHS